MNEITPVKENKPKKRVRKKKDSQAVVVDSKTEHGLTLQQEEFCQLFTKNDTEFYGNGTQSYMEAYGREHLKKYGKPLSYKSAQVLAHQTLRNLKIIDRINELIEIGGFNDQNVDKQHLFLINQSADLKTKLGAIKEYNALKKRVDKPPTGINLNFTITDEQFRRVAENIIRADTREVSSSDSSRQGESNLLPSDNKSKILSELAPHSDSEGVGGNREVQGPELQDSNPEHSTSPREESAVLH